MNNEVYKDELDQMRDKLQANTAKKKPVYPGDAFSPILKGRKQPAVGSSSR
jgi:hypothetical protein